MKTIAMLFSLALSTLASHHQTLVNSTWTATTGLPQTVDWSASTTDPAKNLIICGNTQSGTNDDVDMLITKYNTSGTLLWEVQWNNTLADTIDYGTAVVATDSQVYVCGATLNDNSDTDYIILKLNSTNGNVVWSYTYDYGGQDVPTDIGLDSQGNVLVTGGSEGTTTLSDYATLKINGSSGALTWASRYNRVVNNVNQHDAAAKLVVAANGGVTVTGGSGLVWDNWKFATVRYSSNGTQGTATTSAADDYYYNQPTDMKADAQGNIFICGRVNTTNAGHDIKLLCMDADLAIVYDVTFDGYGEDDMANALDVDDDKNVYMTGYYTNLNNKKELVVMKVDSLGTMEWQQRKKSPFGDAEGKDIEEDDGKIYLTGDYKSSTSMDGIAIGYNHNGFERLFRVLDFNSGENDSGRRIQSLGSDRIYVHGITYTGNNWEYYNASFEFYDRSPEAAFYDGEPAYDKNEVIIHFNAEVLDTATIDSDAKRFGRLEEFVDATMLSDINEALGVESKDFKIFKIHTNRKTSDPETYENNGCVFQSPKYWTWLTLELPENIPVLEACDSLDNLFPSIISVHANGAFLLHGEPNDGQFINQGSLNPIPAVPGDDYDINMVDGWDYHRMCIYKGWIF